MAADQQHDHTIDQFNGQDEQSQGRQPLKNPADEFQLLGHSAAGLCERKIVNPDENWWAPPKTTRKTTSSAASNQRQPKSVISFRP